MRIFAILAVVLFAVVGFVSDARQKVAVKNEQVDLSVYGPWRDGSRRVRAWSDAVGERVVAEGLAWGVREKGLGQRVILDYGHIYVDGAELPQGRLVRVVGKLERRRMSAAPPGVQRYGEDFDYFRIKAETIERLDEVKAPMLAEPTDRK
jgi:hypothetical protein